MGELKKDGEGEQLVADAVQFLSDQGVESPLRFSWLLVPRFVEHRG
jgi:hypothetical protein